MVKKISISFGKQQQQEKKGAILLFDRAEIALLRPLQSLDGPFQDG
jgi:hypothetical protein